MLSLVAIMLQGWHGNLYIRDSPSPLVQMMSEILQAFVNLVTFNWIFNISFALGWWHCGWWPHGGVWR